MHNPVAPAPSLLLVCRAEFTETLMEEYREKAGTHPIVQSPGPGLVLVNSTGPVLSSACIFEHQRLMFPRHEPAVELKPVTAQAAQNILGAIMTERPLWTVHHLVPIEDENEETSLNKRLEGIWNAVVRLGKKSAPDLEKRFRPPHRLKPGGLVLQLLLTRNGLWHSRQPVESMINPRPGGIVRMKFDPLAPSRSYLKLEEALERMPVQPAVGDKVIDLGAAPGGWTFSFIKRGCDVIAVDHGPMKLPPHQDGWGKVTHVQENGITFQPPTDWAEVDWLVGDMLIAPGVALGLLRRWIESGRARRIICNIKLPQEKPYEAIKPIEQLLQGQTVYRYQIDQLYHDRREITVMGWR